MNPALQSRNQREEEMATKSTKTRKKISCNARFLWLLTDCSLFIPPAYELRQQFINDMPMHIGQPKLTSLKSISQFLVVDSQQVHDRGLKIVNVN